MSATSILYRARSLFLGLFAVAAIGTGAAGAPATQRPIEDFVSTQGSMDPFLILNWTDPDQELFTVFDYAGTINSLLVAATGGEVSLGTETSGSITERALPDGRAMVHVVLHTTNAWSFGVDYTQVFPNGVVFGVDPFATLMGAEPGLGMSQLHLKFINTAPGAPLPDLVQLVLAPAPEQELLYVQFVGTAEGPLDDGDVNTPPDGTWGCLHTTQSVPFADLSNPVPAELIDITEGPCEE